MRIAQVWARICAPNPFRRRLVTTFVCACLVWSFVIGIASCWERRRVTLEWQEKFPRTPRSGAEVRGIVDQMIRLRSLGAPPFLPERMWNDALCAAAVVNATNFILGDERLVTAAAWEFARVNAGRLRLVYQREQDFSFTDGHLLETRDRAFKLSQILSMNDAPSRRTSDRLYIVGYHYHETQSDAAIEEAQRHGGTLNSHLMLILGRADGTWWGYHFFHHPDAPLDSPFRIDALGERMPSLFDLVYVWEVLGTEMPDHGASIALMSRSRSYADLQRFLGLMPFFGRRASSVFDGAMMAFVGDAEQFPIALDLSSALVDVASSSLPHWHGQILGLAFGIPVRFHVRSERGTYGREFQCVEFVNRYYVEHLGFANMTKTGDAESYFYAATKKGLTAYSNGGREKPQRNDILIFDRDGPGGDPGHVAIVTSVDAQQVCLVQQRAPTWRTCLSIAQRSGGWSVGALPSNGLPCVGWSRRALDRKD